LAGILYICNNKEEEIMAADLEIQNTEGIFNIGLKTNNGNTGEHPISFSGSTLDWYKLTETSRHVLSQVVSGSIQQQLEELDKPSPDQNRIHKLEQIALEAAKLSRDSKNFKSKERMLEIITSYSNFLF
jgi:poly-D-alanine transfer protein DltD